MALTVNPHPAHSNIQGSLPRVVTTSKVRVMNRAPAFPKPGPSSCPNAADYSETTSNVAAKTSPEATNTIVV